jgi:uncharacterized phage-associated protein
VEQNKNCSAIRVNPFCQGLEEMLDVRALANVVLDQADERGLPITNMALNKIVYFVHCDYLAENGHPLVSAKIEAWQHGPVFREVYHEFKECKDSPISARAKKVDPHTGEVGVATAHFGSNEKVYINDLIDRYIGFSAAQLRAISHLEGGPWHKVWGHDGRSNPGMKITNETILKYYSSGARQ